MAERANIVLPSLSRDRILGDLGMTGVQTTPQNLKIDNVIPTYAIANPLNYYQHNHRWRANFPIAGSVIVDTDLYDLAAYPFPASYIKIHTLKFQLQMDAAGRAAAAAAGDVIYIMIYNAVQVHIHCDMLTDIGAAAGTGWTLNVGTHIANNSGGATSAWPPSRTNLSLGSWPIEQHIRQPVIGQLRFYLSTSNAAGFPANTLMFLYTCNHVR